MNKICTKIMQQPLHDVESAMAKDSSYRSVQTCHDSRKKEIQRWCAEMAFVSAEKVCGKPVLFRKAVALKLVSKRPTRAIAVACHSFATPDTNATWL